MEFPILIIWMRPFSFQGESGVKFHFVAFVDEIPVSKQNSPRLDATFLVYIIFLNLLLYINCGEEGVHLLNTTASVFFSKVKTVSQISSKIVIFAHLKFRERGGLRGERRTLDRQVRGSKPISAVFCP